MRRLLLAIAMLLAGPAVAQEIVADLSQNRVAIDARFDGSEIVIFGAIKPGPPPPADAPALQVIVTVSGPQEPVTVRKKDRVAGIWINREALEIDSAPTLYKVATSAPLGEVLTATEDLRHRISIPQAIRAVDAGEVSTGSESFIEALIRIRERKGLYRMQEGGVIFTDEALFRVNISLPANLVEGEYATQIFLTRGGEIVADFTRTLDVRKVGLERWIYTLAHEQPLVYGLLSLAIAIFAGWGASALFRYVRG